MGGEGAYESVREWVVRVLTRECEGVSGEGAKDGYVERKWEEGRER